MNDTGSSRLSVSVVVPTLNEATRLPTLLKALRAQTQAPCEVIVADAGSQDQTAEIARRAGAVVVPGGKPGQGRNAGARAASGDLLLFLDADVDPPPDFIEKMLAEFVEKGCVAATTLQKPLGDNAFYVVLIEAANVYLQALQDISPHAPGYCILIHKEIHERINGFDEAAVLAEDFDYVQRAARHGRFGVLTSTHVPVSMRRVDEDGFFQVAFKYVWCEMYALAGKPIYAVPFEYRLGEHRPVGEPMKPGWIMDVDELRERLSFLENPLQRLSTAGREQLDRLAGSDWWAASRHWLGLRPELPDVDLLHRYLLQRLDTLRTAHPVRAGWRRVQELPKEGIRVLELMWSGPDDAPARDDQAPSR